MSGERDTRTGSAPRGDGKVPSLIDPVAIARLENMPLRARHVALGALAGLHRSRRRGSSVEFSDHKEYTPGDELRHMDWKVYGKLDKYYVKRFEEETELRCYLLVDASGSMGYAHEAPGGTPAVSKLRYAAFAAAAISYLLLRQQDPVGLLVSGGLSETPYIPPRAREGHLAAVLDILEHLLPGGPTRLADAARRLSEALKPRSLIVVLSDLFDTQLEEALGILRGLRARRHDVVVFHLLDRDELEFPFRELLRFRAMEGEGRELLCDTRATRAHYLRELAAFCDEARTGCERGDVEYHRVDTATPIDRALIDFLVARGQVTRSASARP